MGREQQVVKVIARGLTSAKDLNRAQKSYERYAMTSRDVLGNMPAEN